MAPTRQAAMSLQSNVRFAKADKVLAMSVATLVFIQAILAGQSNRLFGTLKIEIHGGLANLSFLLALIAVVLAFVGNWGGHRVGVWGALFALMFAQIGLGYIGRESLAAAAWHVPLGVAIFGLSVYNITSKKGATLAPR